MVAVQKYGCHAEIPSKLTVLAAFLGSSLRTLVLGIPSLFSVMIPSFQLCQSPCQTIPSKISLDFLDVAVENQVGRLLLSPRPCVPALSLMTGRYEEDAPKSCTRATLTLAVKSTPLKNH